MLRNYDITLVLDVKLSIFEKLKHCLECDVVTAIDSNIGKPKLGICRRFYTKNFIDLNGTTKTLMIFDIPDSQRGCSLILRGGSDDELTRVKKNASFLLFARYNFRLELSYLIDSFAQPPNYKDQEILLSPAKEYDKDDAQNSSSANLKVFPEKESCHRKLLLENIVDFSDPLRCESTLQEEGNVEILIDSFAENSFRSILKSTILSISPFVSYPLPFLMTEQGKKCFLRSFLPENLFLIPSETFHSEKCHFDRYSSSGVVQESKSTSKTHYFLKQNITQTCDSRHMQTTIADFRRDVGRYPKNLLMQKITKPNKTQENDELDYLSRSNVKDIFEIRYHQRLPVLFCSYYFDTNHVPTTFCAEPLLLSMKFYGQDDIMLGNFLERYCFRSSYMCSSCKLPMINHVRKYAHSNGVVTVKISEDQVKNENSNIRVTSRCKICNSMSPKVDLSFDSWRFSFAKYLELKFHAHSYIKSVDCQLSKQTCKHSLHRDHIQYFSSNGLIVSFSYADADIFEIEFPPFIINLKTPQSSEKKIIEESFKSFSIKGYDVFVKIHEKLANLSSDAESPVISNLKKILHKNQIFFKRRVEVVYTLLSTCKLIFTTEKFKLCLF